MCCSMLYGEGDLRFSTEIVAGNILPFLRENLKLKKLAIDISLVNVPG